MNENELGALMAWIDARIDKKIEDAFGRDSLNAALAESEAREKLCEELGFKWTAY